MLLTMSQLWVNGVDMFNAIVLCPELVEVMLRLIC